MDEKPVINFEDAKKLFNPENGVYHVDTVRSKPEEEIAKPISQNLVKTGKPIWKVILFWISIVILAFVIGFSIVNGPALWKKVSYWFSNISGKQKPSEQILSQSTQVSDSGSNSENTIPDNTIIIPKINVNAPVIWKVEENQVQDKLLEGVVHYANTATPDTDGGNVFMTGHSSNFWWIKSNFNDIFALLPEVETGDNIAVTYNKIKYVYRVYDVFTVNPDKIEVMNTVDGKSTLTLMSCIPIGTNYKRLIVRAELLYKDEGKASSEQTVTNTKTNVPESSGNVKPIEEKTSTPINSNSELILPSIP